jgi:CubicO group peptidase (beta-lactamase class C family)
MRRLCDAQTSTTRRAFVRGVLAAGAAGILPQRVMASVAQPQPPTTGTAQLRLRLPVIMREARVPGAALAVLRGGSVAWAGGFGVCSTAGASAVTENTVFEAASLSKPVFAYAVLGLCQEGRLDLDTPLATIVPGYADGPGIDRITARHVLAHTSGLPNWRRGQRLTVNFEPGTRYQYSGEGFVYLQRAVERLTGQALAPWIGRRLFDPLGMKATSFVWRPEYQPIQAAGHDPEGRPMPRQDERLKAWGGAGNADPEVATPAMNAASSLHTTVSDYARFVEECLRTKGGAPYQLSETWKRTMLMPSTRVSNDVSRGLGWGLEHTAEGTAFFHGGNNVFFRNLAIGSVEQGRAIVLLTNGQNGGRLFEPVVAATLGGAHPGLQMA